MRRLVYNLSLLAFFLTPFVNLAQSQYSVEDQTRAINKHFFGEQLKDIAENEPSRYEAIQFYFKSSFVVTSLDCPACAVNMDLFFNIDLFDVTQFESSRLPSDRFTFEFKDKYEIALISQSELNTYINSIDLQSLLSRKVNRPFPTWSLEGAASDFGVYQTNVREWEKDFPEQFKTLYYSEGFYKISFAEFQLMPVDKKNAILSNEAGYLLVD